MPLNRLPNFINSNISLTGVSADYLDGIDLSTISSSLRANRNITGGGTITFDASGNLIWSDRFIVMANGRGPLTAPQGYFDIYMPPAGTTIVGLGGSSSRTVSGSGIAIGGWEALYYILPTGINQITNNGNFRIVTYFSDVDIPHDWVLLAIRNGDANNQLLYLNNGIVLAAGQSNFAGLSGNSFIGASDTENYIAFRGTTGDAPGSFNHGYIGERIYSGSELSELLIFKGNDIDGASGPDRIRLLAGAHRFDTYSSPLSGSFSTVASAASTVRMTIDSTGVSLPRLNFSGGTSTITAQTLADGTISFDSTAGQLFSISNSLTGTIFAINDISGLPSVEVTDLGIIKFNELYGQTVIGSGTPAASAQLSTIARTAATIPLVARGAASQSANLQEWQNNTPVTVASISNLGQIVTSAGINASGSWASSLGGAGIGGVILSVHTNGAPNVGILVRGSASQTGDLQQWQNSAGSVLAKVDSGGNVLANSFQSRYFVDAANSATPYLDFNSNKITVVNRNTGWVNLTVQGIASQTADLQQWQNSASTILGRVSSQGAVLGTLIGTETNYFPYFETIMPGGNDQSWKKLITLNLPVGLYTGLSFAIDISENNGNFGNNATVYKSRYIVSVIRSGGVQDDSNTITIVGPEGNRFLRGLKINSSTYEIQFKQPSDWNQVNVKIQGLSAQTTNITYGTHYQYHSLMSGGTAATVAGTAVYSPTYGNLERFTAINSTQVIAQALDTGTVPLVARATTRTNLVPNPSFETNTTGWDGSFENTTIARTTAVASSGTASLSITSVAAGNMSIRYGYGTSSIPVTQNTQYTFSIFVRSATVSRNMRVFLSWFNGNTFISNSAESPNIASSTTGWTRINVTALAPAGVNYCAPYITILSTAAAGEVHYVDAALLESGPYLGSYIDTTAGMTAYMQEWQNNAGTAVAYVRSDGYANFGGNVQGPTVAGGGWIGGANITANPTVTSGIGIISRGMASQSGDLQQWQDSAGTALSSVNSTGRFGIGSVNNLGITDSMLYIFPSSNTARGLTVGSPTGGGYTADLTRWFNGNNGNFGRVTANADLVFGDASQSAVGHINSISRSTTTIPLVVQATVTGGQTADLTQWRDATSTVIANILSDGSLAAKSVTIQGGGGQYVAGSIYSDANWGMIFRAKQASPAQAHFRWATSADSELMRIDSSGNTTINAIADGTTTTATRGAGYMGMPQVQVSSGGRTLAATDAGKHIYVTTNSSQTITIPANSAVAFPVGTTIVIVNANTISTSIAITTDTLRLANSTSTGTRTLASNGMCTLLKIANTEWIASGNGLT